MELILGEARDEIRLPHSRVPDQDNCNMLPTLQHRSRDSCKDDQHRPQLYKGYSWAILVVKMRTPEPERFRRVPERLAKGRIEYS